MRKAIPAVLAFLLVWPMAAAAQSNKLLATWVQMMPGGGAEARAVVDRPTCPSIALDGHPALPMNIRAQGDANFPLVCSAPMPAGTTEARIEDVYLPIPAAAPQRILVIGDTGCRVKPPELQDCNDPNKWPFPVVAASGAKFRPDLVIHVGDYLYREKACPAGNTGCAGSPSGDDWQTWAADFFTPAAPLMATAPFLIVRGNHEDCSRSGPGFLRLLGPTGYDPAAPCAPHLAPYVVSAGAMNFVVFDDASAPDTSLANDLLPAYQSDFAALSTIAPKPIWLVMHRPIWGAISGPLGIPVGGNETMIAAAGDLSEFAPVELQLAGHIHTFEAINYDGKVPPLVIAGRGGANLDTTPLDLRNTIFQGHSGVSVKDGMSDNGFGFMMMTQSANGWSFALYNADGSPDRQCAFANGRVDCPRTTTAPKATSQ